MSKSINFCKMGIIEPSDRIKYLVSSGTITVNNNIPIKRYYRAGKEIVRTADMAMQQRDYENAYILYMKFMTLFLEKINQHPEYKTVPPDLKKPNMEMLKEVLPKTEKLKSDLLNIYDKEYKRFLVEQQAEQQAEQLRAEREARAREEQRLREKEKNAKNNSIVQPPPTVPDYQSFPQPVAPPLELLDEIVYPNDFPTDPNKSNLLMPELDNKNKQPSFDRNLKPAAQGGDDEQSLRTVSVPGNTMMKFLQCAQKNTINNIETCGILAGQLDYNEFIITHIILPKQTGTADSCAAMNEEELFDIQDQHNLITLGWIHTHPTQLAFLSSVDLHTHCPYQLMMAEAIAIVCAPKYQTTGFFSLTSYGLDYIAQCPKVGFHPHPSDPPLFSDAEHVRLDETRKIDVIDLRR